MKRRPHRFSLPTRGDLSARWLRRLRMMTCKSDRLKQQRDRHERADSNANPDRHVRLLAKQSGTKKPRNSRPNERQQRNKPGVLDRPEFVHVQKELLVASYWLLVAYTMDLW